MTPGVSSGQLMGAVTGSQALNAPVHSAQDIFQQTHAGLINMPGQAEFQNQMSTPGQSMLNTQYGQGSLANIASQQAATQAVQEGLAQQQQLTGQNIEQQMGAQKLASGLDLSQRQQLIGHMGTMLGPALSGTVQGFQAGLGGMTQYA
tara:strand:+ start:220 stop:663 length:444 start_codon:yes stop_codon:yes gene_type:complete